MGGNRWCLNKNRQHKSNHIFFVVDLGRGVFYQKCHDMECAFYVSPAFPIPPPLVEEAASYCLKTFPSSVSREQTNGV